MVYSGLYYTQLGIIRKFEIRIPIKQPVFHGKIGPGIFFVAHIGWLVEFACDLASIQWSKWSLQKKNKHPLGIFRHILRWWAKGAQSPPQHSI